MNVFLATLGCRLNEAEIADWDIELQRNAHQAVASVEDANVIVVNSCAVTAEAARKSRKLVGSLSRKNPKALVAMTGCYASLEPERARALAGVDLVVANRDKQQLVGALEQFISSNPVEVTEGAHAPAPRQRSGRTRAFIKVQDGCRNRCTFCIVTVARGEERSRTITDIVDQIAVLSASGVREAVLTGVHLGGYGADIGTDLTALVRAVLADTDIERVRLSSLEPWDLPDDFHLLWESDRLAPHLHLPLQSGSDATLKRMARRCPTHRFRSLVDRLREHVRDLVLTTDLIVGFPGETESEWQETLSFVESIGFAHMHIFAFSAREGTAAARFSGRVERVVQKRRSEQMHALAATMKKTVQERFLGHTRPVLWESRVGERNGLHSAATDSIPNRYTGYTDNYLRVETEAPVGVDLANTLGRAKLERIENGLIIATAIEPLGGWPVSPGPNSPQRAPRLLPIAT